MAATVDGHRANRRARSTVRAAASDPAAETTTTKTKTPSNCDRERSAQRRRHRRRETCRSGISSPRECRIVVWSLHAAPRARLRGVAPMPIRGHVNSMTFDLFAQGQVLSLRVQFVSIFTNLGEKEATH